MSIGEVLYHDASESAGERPPGTQSHVSRKRSDVAG